MDAPTVPDKPLLSKILKNHVTDTVLYMITTFPFCSISHQQAFAIMEKLSESYDAEDEVILMNFIKKELEGQATFTYPESGNTASGMNMGQIIKIALRLRSLLQHEIDDASSDDEPDEEEGSLSMGQVGKRTQLFEWMRFCKEKIDPIDKVWSRRLEDPPSDASEEEEEPGVTVIGPKDDEEDVVQSVLANMPPPRIARNLVNKADGDKIRAQFAEQEKKAEEGLEDSPEMDNHEFC